MSTPTPVTAQDPSVIVIFGITGDLARNKVLPALYHLFRRQLVNEHTYLVGTSRNESDVAKVMSGLKAKLQASGESIDEPALDRLSSHLSMLQLDPTNDEQYGDLKNHLSSLESQAGLCLEYFFYLSVPPQVSGDIVEKLGHHNLQNGCSHGNTTSRLLIEKPFGYDTSSAQELITKTADHFGEEQVFRIDHYLAKETAQNILTFRQQNPLFNQIWNNRHITKISITAAEAIGIEGRANFYDQVGALRDSVQSHLMQLLSLTLMDIPEVMTAESVHLAKQAVLNDIMPVPTDLLQDRVIRGQYRNYREEVGDDQSKTETYASVVLFSQNERWEGVPLKLTNGKALKTKRTSITVDFGAPGINRLQFRIQPKEGITLNLQVKQPGLTADVTSTAMEFSYQEAFKLDIAADAYERVLIDAMRGDHMLFATDEEVLASWKILQPVLNAWDDPNSPMAIYEIGSDGPDTTRLG